MRSQHRLPAALRAFLILAGLGLTVACGSPTGPNSASKGIRVEAQVFDAAGLATLPSTRPPLSGATIEVLSGPTAGRILSGQSNQIVGEFPPGTYRLRATREGYEPVTRTLTIDARDWLRSLNIYLGIAPHTLHGYITNSRGGRVPFAFVEIIGGSNAGKTTRADIDGYYRFEGLATSGAFQVRATHEDFVGRTVAFVADPVFEGDVTELVHHAIFLVTLTPRAGQP